MLGSMRLQWPLAMCVLLLALHPAAAMDWQWRTGRVTHYGGVGDPWSIHHGSCGYKYLDPSVNKGWDVGALADAVGDYEGSCGRCYEIGCAPMHLKDGFGTGLDRSHVCYNTEETLVVMITDTCPCHYPANAYSNKRWCCGDYYHLDISSWAFERRDDPLIVISKCPLRAATTLADKKYGVIGIRYREVPCDYCPTKMARLPGGQQPERSVRAHQPSWDKRPYGKMCMKSSLEPGTAASDSQQGQRQAPQQQDTSRMKDSSQQSSASSSASASSSTSASSSAGSDGGFPRLFPFNSMLSGWQSLTATSNLLGGGGPWKAPDGRTAFCSTLAGNAALRFKSPGGGSLMGKREMSIEVKTAHGQVPDYRLNLASSSKGTCRAIDLRSVRAERSGDWAHLTIPLINANWFAQWTNDASAVFNGCGGAISAWDVDTLELTNKWGGNQALCISDVKAY